MRGAGPVSVGGVTVYGYFDATGGGVRLRLSVDDWDRLDLCEGRRVAVRLPGRDAEELLVAAADRVPPFVWADLTPAAKRRAG
jgi:hypothetical protein